ncbi:hypothetical protein [Bacillus thuringiensis]|nr:hypothetical protein [Bacillus thuringiensis]
MKKLISPLIISAKSTEPPAGSILAESQKLQGEITPLDLITRYIKCY